MFPHAARLHAAGRLVSVRVTDQAIRAAQQALWREARIAAEPGGATALAALLSGAWVPAPGARIGVLVCGANLDPATLGG
jgi:threonine dehydratase